jgi:hypothetical protein
MALLNKITMKQETLEEAGVIAAGLCQHLEAKEQAMFIAGFIECAKWQEERMYSEAIEFAEWIRIKDFQTTERDNWIGLELIYYTTEELFEKFKKK